MDIPLCFDDSKSAGKMCNLKKSLYDLKQSPQPWFERFTHAMLKWGFKQSLGDHTFFIKHYSQRKIAALIVYIDDIIVTGDDLEAIVLLKKSLSKEFEINDLDALKYFLGIEVAKSKHEIFISQRKYILNLLQEICMLGCKSNDTPIDPNLKLDEDPNGTLVDEGSYQRLVGKLIYLCYT